MLLLCMYDTKTGNRSQAGRQAGNVPPAGWLPLPLPLPRGLGSPDSWRTLRCRISMLSLEVRTCTICGGRQPAESMLDGCARVWAVCGLADGWECDARGGPPGP